MFDMDFKSKGMKWVGNVCQKLEVMFEEVEEKLCQEAKFVESQVETVGVKVNKFFAEIVHDFVPPSCTHPAHEIDSGSSVVQNCIRRDHLEGNSSDKDYSVSGSSMGNSCQSSESTEDYDVRDGDLCLPSSVDPVGGAGLKITLGENYVLKISKPTSEEEDSVRIEKHCPYLSDVEPQPTGASDVPTLKDSSSSSNFSEISNEDHTIACDSLIYEQSCVGLEGYTVYVEPQSVEASDILALKDLSPSAISTKLSNEDHEKACDSLIYERYCPSLEGSTNNVEPQPPKPSDVPVLKDLSPSSIFTEISNEVHEKACDSLTKPPTTGLGENTGNESSQESETFYSNVLDAIDCICDVSSSIASSDLVLPTVHYDDLAFGSSLPSSMLSTESNGRSNLDHVESCMDDIELFDNAQLGDSCILVDDKDLFRSLGNGNHRSCKKTIKHALASRMRTKRREYEQLAILYADLDSDINPGRESSTHCILDKDLHLKKISAHDLSESDWEFV